LASFFFRSFLGLPLVLVVTLAPRVARADGDGGDCEPAPSASSWPAWPAPSASASASAVASSDPACSDDGLCDGKAENEPCDDDNASTCVLVECGGGEVMACKVPEEISSPTPSYVDVEEDGDGGGLPCSIGGPGGAEAASLFTVLGLLLPFASGRRRRRGRAHDSGASRR
jgi:hypothetical protein